MDRLSADARSKLMAKVRGKDTKPEMMVRRMVWGLGIRYRLHKSGLPGRPDLVFQRRRKVIFVHGCFWHQHLGCRRASIPKSRPEFWLPKLEANQQRDRNNITSLRKIGWRTLVVWECQLRSPAVVLNRICRFLAVGMPRKIES